MTNKQIAELVRSMTAELKELRALLATWQKQPQYVFVTQTPPLVVPSQPIPYSQEPNTTPYAPNSWPRITCNSVTEKISQDVQVHS
jgi:hypothetical protein